MSLILSKISLKKNGLTRLSNSNKNIFTKKNLIRKSQCSNTQNETHDKNIPKKANNHITNTSVKKHKQVKKISINDYENKNIRLKNNISPKNIKDNINKSLLIKKNTILKTKKKLDIDNKENQINNNKDKNDYKKIKKKSLNMMIKNTKIKIKQNLTQINKNIKTQILDENNGNKLQKYIIDIENSTEKENNEEKNKKININENKSFNSKEIINTNKTLMIPHNKTNYIENGKPNEEEDKELEENKLINISHDDDIEYILKYEKNNKPGKKMFNAKSNVSSDIINPSIIIRNSYIKYGFKKKNENSRLNIIHRKINSEDNFLNSDMKKIYNSINNEKEIENGNNNINLINNFDIINIITKKEQHKKVSNSLRYKSNNNNNAKNIKEISSENINEEQYQNKYPLKKFKLNGLNIIYNDPNDITKEKDPNPNEILTSKTLRNNNSINKSISLVNSKRNIGQNKWNKNYAIPIVSATLTKNDDIKQDKKYFLKKKLNKKINELIEYNKYNTNPKKHINFGDNNKKKREILFNFNNDNFKYLSFRTKRTNSFIDKRNMHITERNNSINITINENDNMNTNRDVDLDIQEKKLKSICREINKYKFRKKFHNPDLYSLSIDKQIDSKLLYTDKNKDEEININDIKINENKNILNSNKISKKYKTFRIKLNPLNIIKIKNDSFINGGNKLVIKRGDLLNRLRKIKQNFTKLEVSSIE